MFLLSESSDGKEDTILLSINNEFDSLKTSIFNLKIRVIKTRHIDPTVELQGDALVNSLMDECEIMFCDFYATNGDCEESMDDTLKPLYDELVSIKYALDTSFIDDRWKLHKKRLADLLSYQKRVQIFYLNYILNDNWGDTKDQPLQGQEIVSHMIGRCFSLISKILESNKPVSEHLSLIYDQLQFIRYNLIKWRNFPPNVMSAQQHQSKLENLWD